MVEDVYPINTKQTIRRDVLVPLMLSVIENAGGTLHSSDVIAEMEKRFTPTPHEAATNKYGNTHWIVTARFDSYWAAQIGWLTKDDNRWTITTAGRRVLYNYPTQQIVDELDRLWRERNPYNETTQPSPEVALLTRALNALTAGHWTTYNDLAHATGLTPHVVHTHMQTLGHAASHRVLQPNGTIDPDLEWHDGHNQYTKDILTNEGLAFDNAGHADHAARITSHDYATILGLNTHTRHAWHIHNTTTGHDPTPWITHGYIALPTPHTPHLHPHMTRAHLSDHINQTHPEQTYEARDNLITQLNIFLNLIHPNDIIITTTETGYYLGHITGDPAPHPNPNHHTELRRAVTWHNPTTPGDYTNLTPNLTNAMNTQNPLTDLTPNIQELENLLTQQPTPTPPALPEPKLTALKQATPKLAKTNHVSQRWLQETIDLLWDRRQIIFYGPPGTGKTYLARKIAYHLTNPDNVSLVQFHPAYSYEDFFEGYRPAPPTDDGRVGFQLTPGPFRRLVNNAKKNPATPHILIIDEINRANLAKVFGELYFLLEYRDETIDLLYSTGDKAGFTLPDNVFIIGTMNTADRSIALVDAAMRRRFAFLHLHPQEEPTNTILRGWLKHNGHDETLADLHDELNTRIDDPDFAIGPSYFMRPEVRRPGGLERTWRTAILPLLVEYHYGEDIDINSRYGLDTFTHKPDTDN